MLQSIRGKTRVNFKLEMGDSQDSQGRARRLWLAGTALMTVAPAKFAASALIDPAPIDPALAAAVRSAILTPPAWLTEIVGPIDQALRTSGPAVLPALVVLVLLLRLWVNYGRRLFKPVRAEPGVSPPSW